MKIVEDVSECFASLGILFINTHGLIENMKRNMKEQNKETLCTALHYFVIYMNEPKFSFIWKNKDLKMIFVGVI